MSQYRTRADLVLEALESLGALAAGQTPEIEDTTRIDEKLDSIFAKLAGLEIVYVSDPDNIPQAYFADLAKIVADECKTKFGTVGEDAAQLEREGLGVPAGTGAAAMSLKAMTRGRPTFETQRALYF
jgi:hypothetical protein